MTVPPLVQRFQIRLRSRTLQVAEGYRRPLPEHWPPQLAELVTECMAQDPRDRPSAAQVMPQSKHTLAAGIVPTQDAAQTLKTSLRCNHIAAFCNPAKHSQ